MKPSTFLSLNWRDAVNGLVMAILAAIVEYFYTGASSGNFSFTFTGVWHAVVVAVLPYLMKNFFSGKTTDPPRTP